MRVSMRRPEFIRLVLAGLFVTLLVSACGRRVDERTREGYNLVKEGKIDQAIASANAILADHPKHTGALNVLGLALYKSGDLPGAMVPLKKALEIDSKHPEVHFNLGNVYVAMNRPKEAETEFAAAVEAQDKFVLARYNLGKLYEESARMDQAMAQYRRVVDLDPQFVYAHMDLGRLSEESGDVEGAVASYKRATELRPTIKELRVRLGNAYFKTGTPENVKLAEVEYRTAVSIDSLYVDALYSMGVLKTSSNLADEGSAWFRRTLLASGAAADTPITRQIRKFFEQSGIPEDGSLDVTPTTVPSDASGPSPGAPESTIVPGDSTKSAIPG